MNIDVSSLEHTHKVYLLIMNQNVINNDKNNYTQILNTTRDLQRMYYIDKKNYFQQPYNKESRSVPSMEKNKVRTRTFDGEQQSTKNNLRWRTTVVIRLQK